MCWGEQNLDTKEVLTASEEGSAELNRKSGAGISGETDAHLLHSGLWKLQSFINLCS